MGGSKMGPARLFSSIAELYAPKLAIPFTRSELVTRSVTKSAIRLIGSSTHEQERHESPKQKEALAVRENLRSKRREEENDEEEDEELVNKDTAEIGGPRGLEPTRFGDWEQKGRCSDF